MYIPYALPEYSLSNNIQKIWLLETPLSVQWLPCQINPTKSDSMGMIAQLEHIQVTPSHLQWQRWLQQHFALTPIVCIFLFLFLGESVPLSCCHYLLDLYTWCMYSQQEILYNMWVQTNYIDGGHMDGTLPCFSNFPFVTQFLCKIISSKKKTYLSMSISSKWSGSHQATLVYSAMDELKYQPSPFSNASSGKAAGLQCVWQKVSVSECLHLKWKTSTVRPMSLK